MTQVISFINMKGGVGKTTLTVNIGYALAYKFEKRVLIIDVDPQFNASTYLMTENDYLSFINNPKKKTILDIFLPGRVGGVSSIKGITYRSKKTSLNINACTFRIYSNKGILDLIPSTLTLMEIETSQRTTENRLHNFLKEHYNIYDYVLIDCPPTTSIFTQAAILASQKYLVPLKPDPLSTIGLPLLERWLNGYTESAGIDIDFLGIVFCMVRSPMPNQMRKVMQEISEERKGEVFKKYLSQTTKVAESVEKHQPIFLYDENSKWSEEVLDITEELIKRCEGDIK